MAFVCRTTREDHDPNQHYKTPAHVGPGAYNTSRGIAKSRPSYAPFGATTKRRLEVHSTGNEKNLIVLVLYLSMENALLLLVPTCFFKNNVITVT